MAIDLPTLRVRPEPGVTIERSNRQLGHWIPLALASTILLLFITLPILALFIRVIPLPDLLKTATGNDVLASLSLSLTTSLLTLLLTILTGTPAAFLLARTRFPGKTLVETLIDLPTVLPPAVAGVALLIAFGRFGLLGPLLDAAGVSVAFTTAAVVMAQLFVSAPFYVRAAQAGFSSVDSDVEEAAAVFGASNWRVLLHITIPLAWPALLSGMVMAWARALGEFGATIMFAGNILGKTRTMPLAIYTALEGNIDAALVLSLVLVIASFIVLATVRLLTRSLYRLH